jgi:F420-0:gamma-glutamyl ligase
MTFLQNAAWLPAFMLTALAGIPTVIPGDDLAVLMVEACRRSDLPLEDGDIIPITTSRTVSVAVKFSMRR